MKEERKSKVKDNKENLKRLTNSLVKDETEEIAPMEFAPSPVKKDSKLEQEEKELLEVSLLGEIDDEDFPMGPQENVHQKPAEIPVKPEQTQPAPKTMTAKPMNVESTIFNELKGIDFDTEIREENEGKIDWNSVSCLINLYQDL